MCVSWGYLDVWGELASHFNPPPQFSRLGIQVSLAIYVCLSGSWLGGLPLYFSYASVLSTCTRKPIAT